ncbi:MAG: adenosylcobinamide amidohydrolase [Propionibacteriaceae bacterium]|nr:adenosylcobinamide amidohydrolase [Propionibacteriaceae bacterium]
MKLTGLTDVVEVARQGTALIARLVGPSRVASTCGFNGGVREDVSAVYNLQCCEPACHDRVGAYIASRQREQHDDLCRAHGLDPDATAGMVTAASMRRLGIGRRGFRGVEVLALVTAGVEGNAARAGDPATLFEWDGAYEPVGTINTMVFFSHELAPGALLRSSITATEAKASVLEDLAVGSCYSQGRATGTGTDQYVAACPRGRGTRPLHGVGHHSVLGQLLSEAVRDALAEALSLQNGMTPASRRFVSVQLRRFGFSREALVVAAREVLDEADAALFEANVLSTDGDPVAVAAAAGLAAALDQLATGLLPRSCEPDIVDHYARMIAAASSGGAASAQDFARFGQDSPLACVYAAMAIGFSRKWSALHAKAEG